MFIRTVLVSFILVLFGSSNSIQANIDQTSPSPSSTVAQPNSYQPALLMADRRTEQRRDNRQDDRGRQDDREERRDCRQEEGAVGDDKRECKQESRQGENDRVETVDK